MASIEYSNKKGFNNFSPTNTKPKLLPPCN